VCRKWGRTGLGLLCQNRETWVDIKWSQQWEWQMSVNTGSLVDSWTTCWHFQVCRKRSTRPDPRHPNFLVQRRCNIIYLWFIIAALWNKAGHYIFALWFLSSSFFFFFLLFSSPNHNGRRLDVYHYHTYTHGVALVRIYTVSQKTTHLWLAIIFTYTARLQRFLAKMLPRK